MSKKAESRGEVKIVRDTLDEATIYVSGQTRDEAEVAADQEFMDGGVFDFETIWSEFTLEISKVDPRHEVVPRSLVPRPRHDLQDLPSNGGLDRHRRRRS